MVTAEKCWLEERLELDREEVEAAMWLTPVLARLVAEAELPANCPSELEVTVLQTSGQQVRLNINPRVLTNKVGLSCLTARPLQSSFLHCYLTLVVISTSFNAVTYYRPRSREKILRESAPEQDTLSASGFSPVRHKDLHISEWQDGLPAHY